MNRHNNLKPELIETLTQLFKIYSPTYEEHELVRFLSTQLTEADWRVERDNMGNIMARRSEDISDLPLLNAHMDTLQSEDDQEHLEALTYDTLTDRFQLKDVQIGCDDKAGLGIILCLAKYTDLDFKILLTVQEECRQKGVKNIPSDFFHNVCWAFSLDRKGSNDVITEYMGKTMCSEEFYQELVRIGSENNMALSVAQGSRADTYDLANFCPAVNLSVGYYGAHHANDYLKVDETYRTMNLVRQCLVQKERLMK